MRSAVLLVAFVLGTLPVWSREMALTFDDLPTVRQGETSTEMQIEIFQSILDTLDRYEAQATGFVVGNKVTAPHHEELLREFVRKGHSLGNHSFSHFDLNKVSVQDYVADILRCEEILEPYAHMPKYFRYPLLHRGDSEAEKLAVYRFLDGHDYVIAPVSIDNNDFVYNVPAREAFLARKEDELEDIRQQYLAHMKERIGFFEQLAQQKLGREMKHILLLHMSFASATFLEDLLQDLTQQGWELISLADALTDPVYQEKADYCGKKGLGWLERIDNPTNHGH